MSRTLGEALKLDKLYVKAGVEGPAYLHIERGCKANEYYCGN